MLAACAKVGLCYEVASMKKEKETLSLPTPKVVYDWRGNSYPLYEDIGEGCEWEGCTAGAVRLCCIAEGDKERTHWHGAIHTVGGGMGFYCQAHGWKHDHAREELKRR